MAVGFDHELRQGELPLETVEPDRLLDLAGAQAVQTVHMILRHHLVLVGGEGERLARGEPQHDEAPGPRPLIPAAVNVSLGHGTIRVIAEQGRHRAQEILGHTDVNPGVVALALLRSAGRRRIEPTDHLAH